MKRLYVMLVAAGLCLAVGAGVRAQMKMDFFKRPAIASIYHPVVGGGSVYQTTHSNSNKAHEGTSTIEMLVVGRELAGGKDAYWLEFGMPQGESHGEMYSKVLISQDDFQLHRIIFQMPGQGAMEMPMDPTKAEKEKFSDEINKWSKAGTESVTVPAGTFVCQHWKKDDGKGDIWTNENITPFSMVKEVTPEETQVLLKVLTNVTDHITGPVTKFDPQAFGRAMQQKHQQEQNQ